MIKDEKLEPDVGAHVVYGLDADLIMLSLLAPLKNIYLARDDVEDICEHFNLRAYLNNRMKTETAIDDFVVMMYLLGNDFLPHTPSLFDIYESLEFMIANILRQSCQKGNGFHRYL